MVGAASPEETQSQLDKFKEAARELETDDDPERFKGRLGKLLNRSKDAVEQSKELRHASDGLIDDSKHRMKPKPGKPTGSGA